jgi:CrcB protein
VTATTLLLVFVGGGAGATCRYGVGRYVGSRYGGAFPLGTFLINVSGCFALGLLSSLLAMTHRDQAALTALLATGFLGGYTTFSTYALEGILLYNDGSRREALLNLLGSIAAGLCAAAAGAAVAQVA